MMMKKGARFRALQLGTFVACMLALGCERPAVPMDTPELETAADSLAALALDAHGGQRAWESLRYIRFGVAIEQAGIRREVARHLWDRQRRRARVEWVHGDSVVVGILDLAGDEGQVYVDGVTADTSTFDRLLEEAQYRHHTDAYWLAAPALLFSDGTRRAYVPDSSTAEVGVMRVTRSDDAPPPVGSQWFYIDRLTGLVTRWVAPSPARAGSTSRQWQWQWSEYHDFEVAEGVVRFSLRKSRVDAPVAVLTDFVETPSVVLDTMFTAFHPIL